MLGFLISDGDGAVNVLLGQVARDLAATGIRIGGVVQCNSARADMDPSVLPDGPVCRISQDLGPGATGCRLDPDGLETAVGHVLARLDRAQVLILNRFGKQEAEGRGFRPVIGEALSLGIPVVLAIRPDFLPAFDAFAEGMAEQLPPDAGTIEAWAAARAGETQTI